MIIKQQREEQVRYHEQLEKEFMERHQKRIKEATEYAESLTLAQMKEIIFNYKINELEEFEEQFYEDPYDDEFDW